MQASLRRMPNHHTRSQWVRLRTLILLRWMAIAGQLAAVTVADRYFEIHLDLGLCYMVIAAAVIANFLAGLFAKPNRRMSDTEALLTLLFDIAQLAVLLFLTGGITNPFALLLIAPVTISATALRLQTTVILAGAAIAAATFLLFFKVPLQFQSGEMLTMPPVLEFGFWLALVIGILFIGLYSRRVGSEIHEMSDALMATQASLAREQSMADLGGVVAAAAHELGTPLATIKLTSTELASELSDDPELRDDALLIASQADRCRDILRSMGRSGKDDLLLHQAPLGAVLREAAEPHMHRGREILFETFPGKSRSEKEPMIQRKPEIVHGLRSLIQNAVDFAERSVWIDAQWNDSTITVRIIDDGPGFPPPLLSRIGEPFVRLRQNVRGRPARPGYDGMGLGLFIAKTLLERTGAEVSFANAAEPMPRVLPRSRSASGKVREVNSGAIVEVNWPRERIISDVSGNLGANIPLAR